MSQTVELWKLAWPEKEAGMMAEELAEKRLLALVFVAAAEVAELH